MEPTKPAKEPERPELSDSDIQWLQETLGVEILLDYKWKSVDYARAFELYFEKSEKCQWNARNADGNTPLHLVAISENYAAIDGLLMFGADANALNNFQQTPITYSQQCPDYSVGFQFFRHLHKLDFLGQYICKENREWYIKVREIYNESYPRDGYIAAFTQNLSLKDETISNIRAGGEDVIHRMYQRELQKCEHSRVRKRPLDQILKLTDGNVVAENHLKVLKKYTRCPNFHNNYPIFGFMFKRKYRQSLEHHGIRKLAHESSSSSPEKSRDVSSKADYAKNLKTETERSMKEYMGRDDTVIVKLMKKSKRHKKIDQRKVDARSFSESDATSKVVIDHSNDEKNELSSDEKLAKLRKMVARLRTY